jgi:hypothetical protein
MLAVKNQLLEGLEGYLEVLEGLEGKKLQCKLLQRQLFSHYFYHIKG